MKKFLTVLSWIIIIAFLVFVFWFLFLRGGGTQEQQPVFEDDGGFGTFFDSSGTRNNSVVGGTEELEPQDFIRETRIPILRQLSREPVAGYTFFKKDFEVLNPIIGTSTEESTETEEKYVFRFIERATGHILEVPEHELTTEKITSTTVQKIYNAFFSSDGTRVVFEKLSDGGEGVDSYFGEIITNTIEEEGEDPYEEVVFEVEPYSIISEFIDVSPSQNSFAYLVTGSDSSSLFVDNFEGSSKEEIFNSPIKNWLMDWGADGYIGLTTKPSSGEPGYSYIINVSTGSQTKVLDEIDGLTTKLSPSADYVLFAEADGRAIDLGVKNISTGFIDTLSIATLPEKCAFSKVDEKIVYCGAPNRSAQRPAFL
jgi:hypothetical protein